MNPTDVLALTGASAALHISDIPWAGPLAGVRVARVDGELIAFPTFDQQAKADIDLIVACSKDAIVMVEGGAAEATEADVIDALMFAHKAAQPILELIERMRAAVGKPKREFAPEKLDEAIAKRVADARRQGDHRDLAHQGQGEALRRLQDAARLDARHDQGGARRREVTRRPRSSSRPSSRSASTTSSASTSSREKRRIDGRDTKTIRPIMTEVGLLPRVHGSALFQRGETQAIVTTTLGTSSDEQKIDALTGERWKRFMLHYNFPPFSTGETKPLRGPGRREIGHGALAERALAADDAGAGEVPLHHPHRLRDARVERLVVDGRGVRRHALAHGRRRADQGARRRHRDGAHLGRDSASPS